MTPGGPALRVAVIIVHWNAPDYLRQCLLHLGRQSRSPDRVMVVDNGSEGFHAAGWQEEFPQVEFLEAGENLGFARANNLAARQLQDCSWLALLNPDAFPEPHWLERLLEATDQFPASVAFGCQMLEADDPGRLDGTGDDYHPSGLVWRRDNGALRSEGVAEPGEIFSPCAAAALYRRDRFLALGGFDEAFFCYVEDVDLGFRLRLSGGLCRYVPAARVRHVGSGITGRRSDFSLYYGHRNLVWTYVKDMPGVWLWLFLPLHLGLNLFSLVWFGLRGQGAVLWRAKRDALRGLPRVWRQRRPIQARREVSGWAVVRRMSGWR